MFTARYGLVLYTQFRFYDVNGHIHENLGVSFLADCICFWEIRLNVSWFGETRYFGISAGTYADRGLTQVSQSVERETGNDILVEATCQKMTMST